MLSVNRCQALSLGIKQRSQGGKTPGGQALPMGGRESMVPPFPHLQVLSPSVTKWRPSGLCFLSVPSPTGDPAVAQAVPTDE